jgi:hypothetical protein
MKSDRPVVFVSPSCGHCRALVNIIERSGAGDSYRFINVQTERKLPAFVDRVPLMFDGRDIHTDEPLFRMFSGARPQPSSQMAEPQVAPSSGLDGAFSSSFSPLQGAESACGAVGAGNMWLVDGPHDSIETPDSEPMPTKDKS